MKDQLMLLVAVVAGLVATALAFFYIDSATATVEEVAPPNLVEVLMTVSDLPANHQIEAAADLRGEFIDADLSPGLAMGAIKASDMSAVEGRPISSPIAAGVPLLYAHLTPIQDMELGAGMRAMAISVSGENMMGGLLVPGDRVDIWVTYMKPKEANPAPAPAPGQGIDPQIDGIEAMMATMANSVLSQVGTFAGSQSPDDWVTEEVLGNVRIIAVGNSLTGSRQAMAYGMSGGGRGGASTITIEVAPHQAKELIGSRGNGVNSLTLLLRPKSEVATGVPFGG